jgi:hypothetical protein
VNPKDDKKGVPSALPYEFQFASTSIQLMPQYSTPFQYPPQSQQPPQDQQSQKKNQFSAGQLILIIIGAFIFITTPPPIDLVGLGLIIYSLKKYWSRKS